MTTITEYIRQHLRAGLGVVDRRPMPPLEELRAAQWSPPFERLRSNRMVMGAFRYGLMREQVRNGSPYDNVGSLIARARAYVVTGNLEHLVDIANLAMIEFETGQHPNRHFQARDDGSHTLRKPK